MNLGYDKALYLLPFDHRQSYVEDMVHFEPPLDASQRDQVIDSKQLIYEGFRQALSEGVPFEAAGILVDEQFGAAILRDARQRGCVTAPSFWGAVAGYRAQTLTRVEAVAQIARRLREWVDVFEDGREEVREDGHDARVACVDPAASVPQRPSG